MVRRLELAGRRFGLLVAVEPGHNSGGRVVWRCRCDCGAECWPHSTSLISGNTRSCGCKNAADRLRAVTRHGQTKTPEYQAWLAAKARCSRKNLPGYALYGGRGITVCDRWINSFENFIADMGARPSPKHSLDRIDVNGNYSPENCRWATIAVQTRNRRSNVWVTVNGRKLTAKDAALELGIGAAIIYRRLSDGWSIDDVRSHYRPDAP